MVNSKYRDIFIHVISNKDGTTFKIPANTLDALKTGMSRLKSEYNRRAIEGNATAGEQLFETVTGNFRYQVQKQVDQTLFVRISLGQQEDFPFEIVQDTKDIKEEGDNAN